MLHQLLRIEFTRRRDVPCFAAIHHRRWLHRPVKLRALLSRTAVEREPQRGGGADETTHREGRSIVLHRRRGVRRMSQRFEHLRAESELQLALRMAPGDGLQDSTRLQLEDFQQSGIRSAVVAIGVAGLRSRLPIDEDVHDPNVVRERLGRRVQVSETNRPTMLKIEVKIFFLF